MSALVEWNNILDVAKRIESMVAEKEWSSITDLSDQLDRRLRSFFSNQISALSVDDQVRVKAQGAELVALITKVQQQLLLAKQEASQQAGRMAQGRKGISAYKKA